MQFEVALLPGEGAIGAVGTGDVGGLDEIQVGEVPGEANAQEIFGQGASLVGRCGGTGGIFGEFVFEASQLA